MSKSPKWITEERAEELEIPDSPLPLWECVCGWINQPEDALCQEDAGNDCVEDRPPKPEMDDSPIPLIEVYRAAAVIQSMGPLSEMIGQKFAKEEGWSYDTETSVDAALTLRDILLGKIRAGKVTKVIGCECTEREAGTEITDEGPEWCRDCGLDLPEMADA